MSNPQNIPCPSCGGPGGEEIKALGKTHRLNCDDCESKNDAKVKVDEKQREATKRLMHWLKVCPTEYGETDLGHLGLHPVFKAASLAWDATSSKGLGFVGPTGEGKTRMLFHALRRAHKAGRKVFALHHIDFCDCAITAAKMANSSDEMMKLSRAKAKLNALKYADVAFLDDLGKGRSTESANEALVALIEYRAAFRRPILWSSQAGGKWFVNRLGEDRGPAIYRRLNEFCEIEKL